MHFYDNFPDEVNTETRTQRMHSATNRTGNKNLRVLKEGLRPTMWSLCHIFNKNNVFSDYLAKNAIADKSSWELEETNL